MSTLLPYPIGFRTFDGTDIKLMSLVIEDAWETLRSDFEPDAALEMSRVRDAIAKLTIVAFAGGERDPERLTRRVVSAMAGVAARWSA